MDDVTTEAEADMVLAFASPHPPKNCTGDIFVEPGSRDLPVQLALSLLLGLSAFIAFCILRPRWSSLYAARRRRLDPTVGLPALPDSFFGWIPSIYRVSEEQVLASAGLDAFVFLRFFKMAIRLFAIMWLFATLILWPVNYYFPKSPPIDGEDGQNSTTAPARSVFSVLLYPSGFNRASPDDDDETWNPDKGYLWAYWVFTYFFTVLILYYVNWETFRVIRVRQDYLGTQSTITDRTFRLSGLPSDLRSESKIRRLIEKLGIGRVESVTLCRNWKRVDKLVEERDSVLKKLEGAWAAFLKHQRSDARTQKPLSQNTGNGRGRPLFQPPDTDDNEDDDDDHIGSESRRLIPSIEDEDDFPERFRPKAVLRYGPLNLRTRTVDAIDYYEQQLRELDNRVMAARDATYEPGTMAFVTMDSIAACQMAIQARIDPRPGSLLTKPAPAPSDVVWRNTYSPRGIRRLKSWSVTVFVTILTLVWLIPVAALAGLMSICTIQSVAPAVADWLSDRPVMQSLVQTGLPTVTVSLLNIAVPFLYDYLSNRQGLISQGDVELAIISRNFFFTFFNIFVVFAVSGTATTFWASLRDVIKDTRTIAPAMASSIRKLGVFYANFILLQGVGLMPFRLLEVGSVLQYPIMRLLSRTPRDFAEMRRPPTFQYGFYLPTALLVFILCIVYSVLQQGCMILLFGVIYFLLGYFIYKYQLLYAMDQPQHATGGAWPIICYRIILGILVFQVVMSGVLALESAFVEALLILPLVIFTVWYSFYFRQRFEPLTRFISLRSIRADVDIEDAAAVSERVGGRLGQAVGRSVARGLGREEEAVESDDEGGGEEEGHRGLFRRGSTIDEDKEKGLRFVNPNLVRPLEQPWIYQDPPPPITEDNESQSVNQQSVNVPSSDSSFSLGDTHVWRDVNGNRV